MNFFALSILKLLLPMVAFAGTATYSQSDVETLTREFSAAADHSTVSAASAQKLWGKQMGFVVGRTDSPYLNSVVLRSGTRSVDYLPHAALMGSLSLPNSLTFELTWLPYTPIGGSSIDQTGVALKWTLSDEHLKDIPMDIALKLKYSAIDMSVSSASMKIQDSVLGVDLFFSQSSPSQLLEVYGAIGYLQGTDAVSLAGLDSVSATLYSWQGIVGVDVYPIRYMVVGAEWTRSFDRNTLNFKLAGRF